MEKLDLLYLLIICGFFIVAVAYVSLCDLLMGKNND